MYDNLFYLILDISCNFYHIYLLNLYAIELFTQNITKLILISINIKAWLNIKIKVGKFLTVA